MPTFIRKLAIPVTKCSVSQSTFSFKVAKEPEKILSAIRERHSKSIQISCKKLVNDDVVSDNAVPQIQEMVEHFFSMPEVENLPLCDAWVDRQS